MGLTRTQRESYLTFHLPMPNPFHHERTYLLAASAVLLLLFGKLYLTQQTELDAAENGYRLGTSLNLGPALNRDSLRALLNRGGYYTDTRDIALVVDSLPKKLAQAGPLDNLGALNKRGFAIYVPTAWQQRIGGPDWASRVRISRQQMGFDSVLYRQERTAPQTYPPRVAVGAGPYTLGGSVTLAGEPAAGVLVQLKRHPATAQPDTLPARYVYARTGPDGTFAFSGLANRVGYSVVPLKPGCEFGGRQGSARLTGDVDFDFVGKAHALRLIGSTVYNQLKADAALTVRTPAAYRAFFWRTVGFFLLAFWLVHAFFSLRRFHPDPLILPILMGLTGVSVLLMLAVQAPLLDTPFAGQTVQGVWLGLAGMTIVSQVAVGRFWANWWFDPLLRYKNRSNFRPLGLTWLVLGIGLVLLTLLIGKGPEGSGVKVNLSFFGLFTFQPSEITKCLLLLFFAGFFAANESYIRTLPDLRWRLGFSAGAMLATGLLMGLYLLLGDMGPAMVVCFTFILFYAIARQLLLPTLLAGLAFVGLLWLLPAGWATLLATTLIISYLVWKGHARATNPWLRLAVLLEPPLLLLMVFAAFTFGDKLPFVGDRLAGRKAMWLSPFDNDVYGGDHLAHSFWALATGGFTGQGLGQSYARAIPAAHTDMILPSLGEELGAVGILGVFGLMAVLLHRLILHARRAGQPFSFFLVAGLAIATGVQFLLIAGGSLGVLPLTGVSVPLLSYGKISLIVNLVAMGVAFSVAHRPGEASQQTYLVQHYDAVLLTGILGFLLGLGTLVSKLLVINWKASEYVVKPSRVVTRYGEPVFSYNPRIERLTRAIGAGSVFDRNGLVLATSSPETLRQQTDKLAANVPNPDDLARLQRTHARRLYPFGNHLFFWVGDQNTQLFWGQNNGYFAEARHLSELRGFQNHPSKNRLTTTQFRADRFSPVVRQTRTLTEYDYSELATALRQGIDGEEVTHRKAAQRDIRLSVDAALQVRLQQKIAQSQYQKNRVSVVVLDARSGEVITSANHPQPNLSAPDVLLLPDRDRRQLPYPVTERDLGLTYPTAPGSTAKLITALAGFNKRGSAAAGITYGPFGYDEIIRKKGSESEPYGETVDMEKAIVKSSNVYFIRLANELDLDNELSDLYLKSGMYIDQTGGYTFADSYTDADRAAIRQHWRDSCFVVNRGFYKSSRYPRRYRGELSGIAWGQGQLTATPAALARLVSGIANDGQLPAPRYQLSYANVPKPLAPPARIGQAAYVTQLEQFMIAQSNPPGRPKISQVRVAGKTGTPERIVKGQKRNDGWYVFFAPTPDGQSNTVVCVRIEQTGSSADAVRLADSVVVPVLVEAGYLASF
jgi:cell division protein FtsW (lipid II flippase)